MLFLIGSIILTSYLTLSFKLVERFRLNTFQCIVFNYIACVITGSFVNGSFPIEAKTVAEPWFPWALLMGASFISIFNIIGYSTQKIGVAVVSVANKLSLVIPFVFSIYLYKEPVTFLKGFGLVVALIAVALTCWPKPSSESHRHNFAFFLLPIVLFFSSGLLDTMVKYVEQAFLNESNNNAYLITAFAAAGTAGIIGLLVQVARGKQTISWKAMLMGAAIGIPNYFSIWCLVKVLKEHSDNSSAIIPINNMGIVLFSTIVAFLLFKEKLSWINWIGVVLSLGAIALIAFG